MLTHVGYGIYRVSDDDAAALGRTVGGLPREDYLKVVVLPDGREAELLRIEHETETDKVAAKRDWFWAVMPMEPRPAWMPAPSHDERPKVPRVLSCIEQEHNRKLLAGYLGLGRVPSEDATASCVQKGE